MAAVMFSQKWLKDVVKGTDAINLLRQAQFKLNQKPQTSKTGRAFTMMVQKLLEEKVETLSAKESELLKWGAALLNGGTDDISFLDNIISYMADERPLVDYTAFNSKSREYLKACSLPIKSISAQPVKGFWGKIIATYKQNNDARDRDEGALLKILSDITDMDAKVLSVKVEGVRVYMDVQWTPGLELLKTSLSDDIFDLAEAYTAYSEAGIELPDEELIEGFTEALNMEGINQVDTYSLERIINMVSSERISLSDVTGSHSAFRTYDVSCDLSTDIVGYIQGYLPGMRVDKLPGNRIMLSITGSTVATEKFATQITGEFVKDLLKSLV